MRRPTLALAALLLAGCYVGDGAPTPVVGSPHVRQLVAAVSVERVPECGDWLTLEETNPTSATIRVNPHDTGEIVGYFWGLHPWQISAQVHGEPGTPPVQFWVIEGITPGIEWTFQVSELGANPRHLLLACAVVTFEIPFPEEEWRR